MKNVRTIQRFEVSLKAFIVDQGRVLLVQESDTGFWELPGGRIDVGEEWDEHAAVLRREIAEELGDIKIATSDTAVTWVRRRPTDGVYQFIIARPCRLVAGAPRLSDEHAVLAWHTPATWVQLTLPPESGYATGLTRLWSLAMQR